MCANILISRGGLVQYMSRRFLGAGALTTCPQTPVKEATVVPQHSKQHLRMRERSCTRSLQIPWRPRRALGLSDSAPRLRNICELTGASLSFCERIVKKWTNPKGPNQLAGRVLEAYRIPLTGVCARRIPMVKVFFAPVFLSKGWSQTHHGIVKVSLPLSTEKTKSRATQENYKVWVCQKAL